VGSHRSGPFGNARRQVKGGGIENGELPVQQIYQLWAVLDVESRDANALISGKAENL